MTKTPSLRDTSRLLQSLRQSQAAYESTADTQQFDTQMAHLRQWQADRMRTTYADLLEQKQYHDACRFFIDEVQAPLDLTKLTHDLTQMYEMSLKFLPPHLLSPLAKAIELNTLTRQLDQHLLATLIDTQDSVTAAETFSITAETYVSAYKFCDNRATRLQQIALIVEVGKGIQRVARIPLVDVTLRLARNPAKQAGWTELQDFLERGLTAFKKMRFGSGRFLRTFEQRERQIVEQIYAGDANPFASE
ncbi:MAG: hypothetical protein AAF629_18575 [Chloroflexota bacterium]